MSTSYHPKTDGGSEKTNKTVIQLIHYMVDQNQKGWVAKLPRVRFAFMNTVNASTGFSPFQLKTGRSPRLIPPISDLPANASAADVTVHEIITKVERNVKEAQDHLLAAKIQQAFHANQHCGKEIVYKVGDHVMLSTPHHRRNYKQKGKKRAAKFMPRFDGPYTVTAAFPERSEYTLHLPNNPTAFPRFHASLLKLYLPNNPNMFPNREHPRPDPVVTEDGLEEHVIDRILDTKKVRNQRFYLVRWVGYGHEDDEWLPYCDMKNTAALDVWEAVHDSEI